MSLFDDLKEKILANLNSWIEIFDPKNFWTIESFAKVNYNEQLIKPHCVTCVIVNHCWFKDEENKKPVEFDYSKYPDISMEKQGLYHPIDIVIFTVFYNFYFIKHFHFTQPPIGVLFLSFPFG